MKSVVTKTIYFGSLLVFLCACQDTDTVYSHPLRDWRSVGVPAVSFPISADRSLSVPDNRSVFRAPWEPERPKDEANLYFFLEPVTGRLIDWRKIAEYRDAQMIEYEFGRSLSIYSMANDVPLAGDGYPSDANGSPRPARTIRQIGHGEISGQSYHWRCGEAIAGDVRQWLDCTLLMKGSVASVIRVGFGIERGKPVENVAGVLAERVMKIEQSFITR